MSTLYYQPVHCDQEDLVSRLKKYGVNNDNCMSGCLSCGQERHLELGQTSGNYKAQFPACENHRNVGKTYSH